MAGSLDGAGHVFLGAPIQDRIAARGGVRFHHGEQVNGMMAPLLTQRRQLQTKSALDAMNTARKQRAQRAYANTPAAAS